MAAVKKSTIVVAFGTAARTARNEQGHSQEAFAAMIGIDRSYYGAIERGEFNPSLDMILRIADGLSMRVGDLMRRAQL
jgi:transcriptional regulator with XRE-family HTH domain